MQARLDRLKMETGQELVNAEIAVRTRDTPTSMQYENTAPTEYFQRYSQSKVLVLKKMYYPWMSG